MEGSIVESIVFWVMGIIATLGYPGVFFLMAAESALIPIPSEIIMPFSGFLVSEGRFNFWAVVLAGTVGNLFGSWLAYALGWWAHDKIARRLVKRFGKFILLTEEEYDKAVGLFSRNGQLFVAISRVLPAVRTVISLPAGVARLQFLKFSLFTVVGCFIWSAFLTYLGFLLGENWQVVRPYFRKFDIVILAAIIILVGAYLFHKLGSRKLSAKKT